MFKNVIFRLKKGKGTYGVGKTQVTPSDFLLIREGLSKKIKSNLKLIWDLNTETRNLKTKTTALEDQTKEMKTKTSLISHNRYRNSLAVGKNSGQVGLNSYAGNTSFGDLSFSKGNGSQNVAIGAFCLAGSKTSYNTSVGYAALAANLGGKNTALGSSAFRKSFSLVSSREKSFLKSAISGRNITIPNHNFGTSGNVYLAFKGRDFNGSFHTRNARLFRIIDSNTIAPSDENIDFTNNDPANTEYTLSTIRGINNSVALGYKSSPDKSNQVMLGNNDTKEVKTKGDVVAKSFQVEALNTAPESSTAQGKVGEIRITADYIYVCVAENSWKRCSLAGF